MFEHRDIRKRQVKMQSGKEHCCKLSPNSYLKASDDGDDKGYQNNVRQKT